MAIRRKTKTVMEASVLVLVVALPLFAIGWYFLGGDAQDTDTSDTAPSDVSATVSAPTSQQQGVQHVPITNSGTGTITLDDPSALPSTVTTGQIVPFSFKIHNTGATASSFPYKVYVRWNSGEVDVIDENSVTIAAGASTEFSEALKFETGSAKGTVYIEFQPGSAVSGATVTFAMPRA